MHGLYRSQQRLVGIGRSYCLAWANYLVSIRLFSLCLSSPGPLAETRDRSAASKRLCWGPCVAKTASRFLPFESLISQAFEGAKPYGHRRSFSAGPIHHCNLRQRLAIVPRHPFGRIGRQVLRVAL